MNQSNSFTPRLDEKPSPNSFSTNLPSHFLLTGILVIAICGAWIYPEESWAWVLMVMTFIPLCISNVTRNHKDLLYSSFFLIFTHNTISIINAFLVNLWGSGKDNYALHEKAMFYASGYAFIPNFTSLYDYLLAQSYQLSSSFFFGQELSVFFFALSIIVFVKIMDLFEIVNFRSGWLLIFGLMPPTLMWTSYIMRESLLLLLMLLYLYHCVVACHEPNAQRRFKQLLLVNLLLLSLMLCHKIFVVASPLLFVLSTYIIEVRRRAITLARVKWLMLFFLMAVFIISFSNIGQIIYSKISALGLWGTIKNMHNSASTDASSYYEVVFDSESTVSSILSVVQYFIYYLISPIPTFLRSHTDLVSSLFVFFKLMLLGLSIVSVALAKGAWRSSAIILLLTYLIVNFIYSLGTSSYGTGFRHQLITDFILVLLAAYALHQFSFFKHFRSKNNLRSNGKFTLSEIKTS